MYYRIIATGSKGNSVQINELLIDCGISFNRLKEHLYTVKWILITHSHTDHCNIATLKRIRKLFPKIQIYANVEVAQVLLGQGIEIESILNPGALSQIGPYQIMPFLCPHDVLCTGFSVSYEDVDREDVDFIYATDTTTLSHAPDKKYDYFFIEGNYCEQILAKALGDSLYVSGSFRHLSIQKMKLFFYTHRKTKEARLIQLHCSNRFGYLVFKQDAVYTSEASFPQLPES